MAGINRSACEKLGVEIYNFISDEDVAAQAKERGMTRSAVAMEKAARLDGPSIFAIGNAPTALIRLYELMETEQLRPGLIIGVPVGFVNVVQAKELIVSANVPSIVARGRKGGSNVAAAIVNALLYQLTRKN
jgi:precorrin-8X/cobalt-precorrin-8 methylmutase